MNSEFLRVNLEELTKGVVIVVLGTVMTALLKILEQKGFNLSMDDLMFILNGGTIAGLSYLIKTLFQTESGDQLGGIIKTSK